MKSSRRYAASLFLSLLGFPVRDTRPLVDRSDEDLVLVAGYSSASVRAFRRALTLGMSESDAEQLLRQEVRRVA